MQAIGDLLAMPGPYQDGYLTAEDVQIIHSTKWKLSHNAARGGVRLIGSRPKFARPDRGDDGAHPSNIPKLWLFTWHLELDW